MKRSVMFIVLSLGFLFLTENQAVAQSNNISAGAQRTQEQSLQDLVAEVRQLRAMLQRIQVTTYKTNVVVEQLKFQQEAVSRLSRELNEQRENLGDARSQIIKMKELVTRVESGVEAGIKSPDDLAALKMEIEIAHQRELRLAQRETMLINDLSVERQKLLELNDRLSKLELELSPR